MKWTKCAFCRLAVDAFTSRWNLNPNAKFRDKCACGTEAFPGTVPAIPRRLHHARDTLYNGVYVVYMANIQYVYTAAHHLMPACVYCVYRYHIQYLLYINVLLPGARELHGRVKRLSPSICVWVCVSAKNTAVCCLTCSKIAVMSPNSVGLYKIVHKIEGYCNSPISFKSLHYDTRHSHSWSLLPIYSHCSFLFPHSISLWNSLSYDIVNSSSLDSFKHSLISVIYSY